MADHPPAQDNGWITALGMTLTALMGAGARPFWSWVKARARREEQREDKLYSLMEERIERLEARVDELTRDRESLRVENAKLEAQVSGLEAENAQLREQVGGLETRVLDQQQQIEALQKAAS